MTEIVDVRKVVAKMRLLASNAENRPFIAKDKGCLRGLLAFLDNTSDDIVFTALEALMFLCMHQPNIAILQSLESLPAKVGALSTNSAKGQEIQNIATQLDDVLKSGSASAVVGTATPAAAVKSPLKDRTNQHQALLSSPAKSPAFKTPAKQTISTICLKIEGVATENDRSVIERSIVSLKGVISVAIDSRGSANAGSANSIRATVRTRLSHESLLQHVAAIGGFKACLETDIKDGASVKASDSDSPKYMTPPELQANGKEMVMHSTAKNDSVAARLAEQKKKNEQAGSWLSKVGKALWII